MNPADFRLLMADTAPVAGVVVLRVAWARPQRSASLNGLGWLLLLGGTVLCGFAAGAWGVSVSALFGMAAACFALAWAALRSPPGKRRAPSRGVGMMPESGKPLRIGGRLLTFVLVGIVASAVSVALAVATRGFARLAGLGDADATALALMLLPLAWALIAFFVLMQKHRRGQIVVLFLACLPALPALVPGLLG